MHLNMNFQRMISVFQGTRQWSNVLSKSGNLFPSNSIRVFGFKRKLTAGPQIAIPKVSSLTDYVFGSTGASSQRIALIDSETGQSLTFDRLVAEIEQVSINLGLLGIGHGDVITYFGTNRIEIIHLLCACARIGGILSLANAQLTTDELKTQMDLSSTKMLVTSPERADVALNASKKLNEVSNATVFI